VIKSGLMRYLYIAAFLAFSPYASALEIHFRPSFVELVSEGVSQRVRPGELVEVPVGDSTIEMDIGEEQPRVVTLRATGRCEFRVFSAPAVLEDGGTMSIGMDPESRKLDISWVRGEMKSPPGQFDKSATAAFFSGMMVDSMRSMDFPGVRPFGYTDALEGRGSMVMEGDYRNLPPLPPPQLRSYQSPRSRSPYDYYPEEEYAEADWRTYEEDVNALPPLSLPPPSRRRVSDSRPPRQLLVLSPAPPSEIKEDGDEKQGAGENDPTDASQKKTVDPESSNSAESSIPPKQHETSSPPANDKNSPSDPEKSAATNSESSLSESKQGGGMPDTSKSANEPSQDSPLQTSVTLGKPEESSSGAPQRPRKTGSLGAGKEPTLYDRIVAQEEKQKAVLELLHEVSQQVKELKAPPAASGDPDKNSVSGADYQIGSGQQPLGPETEESVNKAAGSVAKKPTVSADTQVKRVEPRPENQVSAGALGESLPPKTPSAAKSTVDSVVKPQDENRVSSSSAGGEWDFSLEALSESR